MKKIGFAVEVLTTCLDREVNYTTGRITKLCRVNTRRESKFRKGVRTWCYLREECAVLTSTCLCAVYQTIRTKPLAAIDSEIGCVCASAARCGASRSSIICKNAAVKKDGS